MEFPAMVYRRGSMFEWDGEIFDYLIVNDAEEAEIALADGWCEGKPPAATPKRGRPHKEADE